MSANWWLTKSGKNTLLQLSDELIMEFIVKYPKARADFDRLVVTMDAEEKPRLQERIDANPFVKAKQMRDPREGADRIQNNWNRAGVRRIITRRKDKPK